MLLLSLNLGSQLRGTTTTHGDSRARLSVRPRGRLQYSLMPTGNPEVPPAAEPVSPLYDTRLPQLSRWRRMQIPLIASTAIAIIRGLGPTLRFEELGQHHYVQSRARGEPVISAFWHRCIISATWYWRNQGAVVMNTTNFEIGGAGAASLRTIPRPRRTGDFRLLAPLHHFGHLVLAQPGSGGDEHHQF